MSKCRHGEIGAVCYLCKVLKIEELEAEVRDKVEGMLERGAEIRELRKQLAELKILAEPLTKELYKEMSERHEAMSLQLAALREALEWIRDGCDVEGRCKCGRPTGVLAIHQHAKAALLEVRDE